MMNETHEALARARGKLKKLWQLGDLFHTTTRRPHKRGFEHIDRLAGILRNGIVAPGACTDGSVCSDLNLTVTGVSVPYDSLVFLHKYNQQSFLYTLCEPDRFAVFVAPEAPVLTRREMGRHWAVLCQDEVYVRERVAVEHLLGLAVHPADAEAVLQEFLPEFEQLGLPLYHYDGTVVWPPNEA
jgi:hypothetical protein